MGLIKSNSAPIGLSSFSMRDIEIEAHTLLARARRAAELLLADAQKEAESIRTAAKAEGFAQGHRDGIAKATQEGRTTGHQAALADHKSQMTAVWSALSAAVTQIDADRRDLESFALGEVVQLALGIARRVTKRQAQIDPSVLTENLKEAMKLAVHSADVRLAINPAQRETLNRELPNLQLSWPKVKHVELTDDPAVAVGGVKITTRHGELDAQIDVQLDRVMTDLMPPAQVV
jgi:flagellar assembly protein FliH